MANLFKSKLLGNRDAYSEDVLGLVDRVDCVIKGLNTVMKHSEDQLKHRDVSLNAASQQIATYAQSTANNNAAKILCACVPQLQKVGEDYQKVDIRLLQDFTLKLQNWLAGNQKSCEMAIKNMEDLRKNTQKMEKRASNDKNMEAAANASQKTWKKAQEDTMEIMKKFLTNAEEIKNYVDTWVLTEKALMEASATNLTVHKRKETKSISKQSAKSQIKSEPEK